MLAPTISFAGNVNWGGSDCNNRPSQSTSLIVLASLNGTDDRFTQRENNQDFLAEAFQYTGELFSEDGACRYRGSGFINNGRLTTARHVICGMIERNCDLSKIKLKTESHSYSVKNVTEAQADCLNKDDVITLDFKETPQTAGLLTATTREGGQIIRSGASSCHIIGVHADTGLLQASRVRHLVPGRVDNNPAFAHCADTYPGSSGGALVCNVNGAPKVLGINSLSAFSQDENHHVESCNPANISENGTWARYLQPTVSL